MNHFNGFQNAPSSSEEIIEDMRIQQISFPSPLDEVDPENDNIDVHVELDDGRVYSFLLSTPNNVSWCMENENVDFFFSYPPPLFVSRLTRSNIEKAVKALLSDGKEEWLRLYAVLQTKENDS